MTVTEDVLLYLLDKDPQRLYDELATASVEAVAVCLTYGKDLPAGCEWGSRGQRKQWLESERAKHVRKTVAAIAAQSVADEAGLMRLYRAARKKRGYGPLLKRIVRDWHAAHNSSRMELV